MLERTEQLQEQIAQRLAKRAKVFPTGAEVISGQIKDTNTPFLVQELKSLGFTVATSPALPDQMSRIVHSLRDAVEEGYGLIITTGGVGAEGKDQSVEALLALDPDAATPYVLKFTKGQGRHAKDGVRLGVGPFGPVHHGHPARPQRRGSPHLAGAKPGPARELAQGAPSRPFGRRPASKISRSPTVSRPLNKGLSGEE